MTLIEKERGLGIAEIVDTVDGKIRGFKFIETGAVILKAKPQDLDYTPPTAKAMLVNRVEKAA